MGAEMESRSSQMTGRWPAPPSRADAEDYAVTVTTARGVNWRR
jgi:hypothetical protein